MSADYDINEAALELPCRYCGADPYQPCRFTSGNHQGDICQTHGTRIDPIRAAYGNGHSEGYELGLQVRAHRDTGGKP